MFQRLKQMFKRQTVQMLWVVKFKEYKCLKDKQYKCCE